MIKEKPFSISRQRHESHRVFSTNGDNLRSGATSLATRNMGWDAVMIAAWTYRPTPLRSRANATLMSCVSLPSNTRLISNTGQVVASSAATPIERDPVFTKTFSIVALLPRLTRSMSFIYKNQTISRCTHLMKGKTPKAPAFLSKKKIPFQN